MSEPAGAQIAVLDNPDGGPTLHLQHGPIDLIIRADGEPAHVRAAFSDTADFFEQILAGLVSELPRLRAPATRSSLAAHFKDPVAERMRKATLDFVDDTPLLTPMAAVAGSVADAVLDRLLRQPLDRCFVNNGGDIALHTAPGFTLNIGIVDSLENPTPVANACFGLPDRAVRAGVATSGWRGRSHSLGIADAVTAIADCTARADVAATLVANAVNVDHMAIRRERAELLEADSDLGELPVTVACGQLDAASTRSALNSGADMAKTLVDRGLCPGIAVFLQGLSRFIGDLNIPGYDIPAQSSFPDVFEASNER